MHLKLFQIYRLISRLHAPNQLIPIGKKKSMDVCQVLCSISHFCVYMCVRMPSSPRPVAGALWPCASVLPYYYTPL